MVWRLHHNSIIQKQYRILCRIHLILILYTLSLRLCMPIAQAHRRTLAIRNSLQTRTPNSRIIFPLNIMYRMPTRFRSITMVYHTHSRHWLFERSIIAIRTIDIQKIYTTHLWIMKIFLQSHPLTNNTITHRTNLKHRHTLRTIFYHNSLFHNT